MELPPGKIDSPAKADGTPPGMNPRRRLRSGHNLAQRHNVRKRKNPASCPPAAAVRGRGALEHLRRKPVPDSIRDVQRFAAENATNARNLGARAGPDHEGV